MFLEVGLKESSGVITVKSAASRPLPKGPDAEVPWTLAPRGGRLTPRSPLGSQCYLSPAHRPMPRYQSTPTQDQTGGRLTRVSGLGLPPLPLGLAPRRTRSHDFLTLQAPLTSFTERNSSNGKTKCRSKKCAMRVVKSYSAILSRKRRVSPH